MTDEDRGFSLKRWSARKLDAARAPQEPQAPQEVPAAPTPAVMAPAAAGVGPASQAPSEPPLPPVESLTFGSDFTAFMKPKVAEAVKREALKKLFADPHFNVMDGLDVYIDDYSIPSPLGAEEVSELWHARSTLNPPRTRINAAGHAEDVVADEDGLAAEPEAAAGAGSTSAPEGIGTSSPAPVGDAGQGDAGAHTRSTAAAARVDARAQDEADADARSTVAGTVALPETDAPIQDVGGRAQDDPVARPAADGARARSSVPSVAPEPLAGKT